MVSPSSSLSSSSLSSSLIIELDVNQLSLSETSSSSSSSSSSNTLTEHSFYSSSTLSHCLSSSSSSSGSSSIPKSSSSSSSSSSSVSDLDRFSFTSVLQNKNRDLRKITNHKKNSESFSLAPFKQGEFLNFFFQNAVRINDIPSASHTENTTTKNSNEKT